MDRFKRGKPTKIKLADRDLKIFRLLSVHRVLNSGHIAIFLGVRDEPYYRRRLRALFDNYYLDRIKNYHNEFSEAGSDKIIYALSDTGAEALNGAGEKIITRGRTKNNDRLKVSSLKHDLLTVDFLTSALSLEDKQTKVILSDEILATASSSQRQKKNPLSMNVEFKYLDQWTHKALIPDSLFAIEQGARKHYYFLETDTGTENQTRSTPRLESILRKMKGYSNIYKDKIAKESFGIAQFKVLFLTTTEKRIDYMIKNVFDEYIAGDIPRNIFLFSTFEKVKNETLAGDIWKDCRGNKVKLFTNKL